MTQISEFATLWLIGEKLPAGFFVSWIASNGREFPWRKPGVTSFQILITEMLVRQTRAESVAQVWEELFDRYPDAESLAKARPTSLFRIIRRLGFGKMRTNALISAARWIVDSHKGCVPSDYESLIRIPHVGRYAANAVLCFAFGKKIEIVDANVQRLISRYFGFEVQSDIRRNPLVHTIANRALPRSGRHAVEHNYGILDFTAAVCKPLRPKCGHCRLSRKCAYYRSRSEERGDSS